ncbi:PH domain-containing protein [Streptomyces albus]|uniref:PH domain-containing protein n=1 Tax=Streptomyces albus TaxID=1888 RepID=UPI0013B489BD|nr:PH domain-containing protein [Streptomyces albus]QID39439.1 PH domain-containing protein [Streptomyces albus]
MTGELIEADVGVGRGGRRTRRTGRMCGTDSVTHPAEGECRWERSVESIVLRRRMWPVFVGIVVPGLGIAMIAAVWNVTAVNGFRTGWQGIPVYLAGVGVIVRVACCRVELRETTLLVVNPLRTHTIPKSAIRDVSVNEGGTLGVWIDEEQEIQCYAFGGSLIDHFLGTSDKAERTIERWRSSGGAASKSEATPRVSWTLCPPADVAILLCIVITVTGIIWMAIAGT